MSDIQARVVKIVAEHIDVDESKVTENASFADDLGADSPSLELTPNSQSDQPNGWL